MQRGCTVILDTFPVTWISHLMCPTAIQWDYKRAYIANFSHAHCHSVICRWSGFHPSRNMPAPHKKCGISAIPTAIKIMQIDKHWHDFTRIRVMSKELSSSKTFSRVISILSWCKDHSSLSLNMLMIWFSVLIFLKTQDFEILKKFYFTFLAFIFSCRIII